MQPLIDISEKNEFKIENYLFSLDLNLKMKFNM